MPSPDRDRPAGADFCRSRESWAHIASMSVTLASQELRRRASVLRTKAQQLDHALIFSVRQRADADTWTGPVADQFLADLHHSTNQVDLAVDGLKLLARSLDRQADHLEAAAAMVAVPGRGPN